MQPPHQPSEPLDPEVQRYLQQAAEAVQASKTPEPIVKEFSTEPFAMEDLKKVVIIFLIRYYPPPTLFWQLAPSSITAAQLLEAKDHFMRARELCRQVLLTLCFKNPKFHLFPSAFFFFAAGTVTLCQPGAEVEFVRELYQTIRIAECVIAFNDKVLSPYPLYLYLSLSLSLPLPLVTCNLAQKEQTAMVHLIQRVVESQPNNFEAKVCQVCFAAFHMGMQLL
jgi:hypothetical protein